MNRCTKIIYVSISVFLLSAGMAAAQVGPDGYLAYTLSNYQPAKPAADNPETFIIRNRLDSGCTWTASADALIMTRTGGKSSILFASNTGTELLNSNGFIFNWATGPRVGIVGEDILFGCDVEASYFGIDGWSASHTFLTPADGGFLNLFNELAMNVNPGDIVRYDYISRLHSTEINLRHPLWERLSVLMGFRYVELHEELNSSINDVSVYNVNTDNHLYGGQIGMNVAFINTCRFSIEGVIKAGVFGNYSDMTMSIIDLTRLGDRTTHTAALGEIGLMGIFQVTNHLALRGGYQAMWLDGIAIASDQPVYVNQSEPKPYMGGTLFYHGATAGLEYAF